MPTGNLGVSQLIVIFKMLKWLVTRTPGGAATIEQPRDRGNLDHQPAPVHKGLPNSDSQLDEKNLSVQSKIGSYQSQINNLHANLPNPLKSKKLEENDKLYSSKQETIERYTKLGGGGKTPSIVSNLPAIELAHITKTSRIKGALVTDDPLATLSGKRTNRGKQEEIYAVSR